MGQTLVAVFVLTLSSLAAAAGATWTCEVEGLPEGQSVTLSLLRPTLVYHLRYVTSDGKVVVHNDGLITDHYVTTYRIHHSGCREKVTSSPDGKNYELAFQCGSVSGFFRFDEEAKAGVYHQALGTSGPTRTIAFGGCALKE